MTQQDIHLELLLSKRVVDANAQLAGRIEEVCAEQQGEETVIQEYLLGPDALGARLAVWLTGLRLLHWLGVSAATPPHMRKEQGPRERFVLSWRAVRGSS
jgi:hypothetical protein